MSSFFRLAWSTTATIAVLASASAAAHDSHDSRDPGARLAESLEKALTANPETFQFTNMRDFMTGNGTEGGAFLVRSKNGLAGKVMSGDLIPGHAYTVWWIIFNKPRNCATTPCGAADFPNADAAIFFASGAIASMGTSGKGVVNAAFSTDSGGLPSGTAFNPTMPQSHLLPDKGFTAEVHMVIADHGVPTANPSGPTPDDPGTWGWELTHGIPPTAWVRAAIFLP